jgi:membrane-bound metal-dependent hydrolase YbcI (DUF457 family)
MFVGHFAVGLAAKKINTKPSLGTYFLAAQFLDLLWPTFLLLGIEKAAITTDANSPIPLVFTHYPVSHSLLAVMGWGFLFGLIYFLVKKQAKAALLLGVMVVSHWLLDLLVHIEDLPLYPGDSPLLGLGLWKIKMLVLAVELSFFAIGSWMYLKSTTAKNKTGTYGTIVLLLFLLVVHLMNIFGPPPPDMKAVAWAGQLQWLFVIWAYWIDKNRRVKNEGVQVSVQSPLKREAAL